MDQSTLNTEQLEGTKKFVEFIQDPSKKMASISGPAGVGKTYLTKFLLQMLPQLDNLKRLIDEHHVDTKYMLLANTNKAARSLAEATGLDVSTVHSGLGFRADYSSGKLVYTATRKTRNTLIIIDEAFGLQKDFLQEIFDTCENCKFLMIGDEWQLPPINENHSSLVGQEDFFINLTIPMRQTAGTPLQLLCEDLRQAVINSKFPEIHANNIDIVQIDDHEVFKNMILADFSGSSINNDDVKVLAYTNSAIRKYNRMIGKSLGYTSEFQVGATYILDGLFKPTKYTSYPPETPLVIQSVKKDMKGNFSGVWVTGLVDGKSITGFIPDNAPAYKKTLYGADKLSILSLRLNFALTVHKAQGSTYNTVFIDTADILDNCYDATTLLRLLSVGVSRARTKVVIYGT